MNQSDMLQAIVTIMVRQHQGRGATGEKLRQASGLTAEAIGKMCGCSASTVYSWEAGTTTPTANEGLRWLLALYEHAPNRPGLM